MSYRDYFYSRICFPKYNRIRKSRKESATGSEIERGKVLWFGRNSGNGSIQFIGKQFCRP